MSGTCEGRSGVGTEGLRGDEAGQGHFGNGESSMREAKASIRIGKATFQVTRTLLFLPNSASFTSTLRTVSGGVRLSRRIRLALLQWPTDRDMTGGGDKDGDLNRRDHRS